MIATQINTDKSILSLSFDTENLTLSGDNEFYVTLEDIGDEFPIDLEVSLNVDPALEVTPNSFMAIIGEAQYVSVRINDPSTFPEGIFNFEISINNSTAAEKKINTSVVSSDKTVTTDNVYKTKYFIQRENYTCFISQLLPSSQSVTAIEINGTCDLSYQERKDLTDPIVAATLKMRLDTSLDLTLEDLYSENEREYLVTIEKNSNVVFVGYILPDGIWADFVSDKWQLEITATCGLASLKNHSFSQSNTANFYGRMTAIDIIQNCLKKTGLNLPIYVNCQIVYNGWVGYNILGSIYLSVERYLQNRDEPMDCDAVLRSILQIFGATIVQQDNAWFIYRSRDMVCIDPLTTDYIQQLIFSVYFGATYQQNVILEFGDSLGSHINNAEKFHVSSNQRITISPSVQAYKISYELGESKNVFSNSNLQTEGAVVDAINTLNIPGWNVPIPPDGSNKVRKGFYNDNQNGIRSFLFPNDNPSPIPILIELDQSIFIKQDSNAVLTISYRNNLVNSVYLYFSFGITNGTTTQWFRTYDNTWVNFQEVNKVYNGTVGILGRGKAIYELAHNIPMDGNLILQIFRNYDDTGNGVFGIDGISYAATNQGNIKSKDYIGRKIYFDSSAVKSSVTVYNGDTNNELFVGTIYKSDGDTPTDLWTRYYLDSLFNIVPLGDDKELLEIIVGETLSMNPRPMTMFEGDFKGFIKYVNFITIDSFQKPVELKKQFQFMKWSYSFDDDITKMMVKEIEQTNLDPGVYQVNIYENFGNETKVVIK